MKPTYPTGQPVNLFDGVIASVGEAPLQLPGLVIGFPADNQVTVALIDARYCESDGRKEATERGHMTRFFRADQGIVCLDTLGVTLETSKLSLALASTWGGGGLADTPAKRGVLSSLDAAVCSPEPLAKSATPNPGGTLTQSQPA